MRNGIFYLLFVCVLSNSSHAGVLDAFVPNRVFADPLVKKSSSKSNLETIRELRKEFFETTDPNRREEILAEIAELLESPEESIEFLLGSLGAKKNGMGEIEYSDHLGKHQVPGMRQLPTGKDGNGSEKNTKNYCDNQGLSVSENQKKQDPTGTSGVVGDNVPRVIVVPKPIKQYGNGASEANKKFQREVPQEPEIVQLGALYELRTTAPREHMEVLLSGNLNQEHVYISQAWNELRHSMAMLRIHDIEGNPLKVLIVATGSPSKLKELRSFLEILELAKAEDLK